MATLDISEYFDSSHGNPIEPAGAHQAVELGVDPAQSKRFHKNTKLVRIVASANCRVCFADSDKVPAALAPLAAGEEMIRTVHPDSGFRLWAALAGEDGQMSGDRVDALIALITNPAACAKRKAELDRLEKAVDAKSKKHAAERRTFDAEHAAHAQAVATFTKDKTEFERFFAEHDGDLKGREAVLAQAQARLESETAEAQAVLARREKDVTAREDAVADRARLVAQDEARISGVLTDLERRRALIKEAGL